MPKRGWLTPVETRGSGAEDRERGAEAEARHSAYVQNAYATMSPAGELLRAGAWAGLQTGAAFLAVETAILLALLAVNLTIGGSMAAIYGATPLLGTPWEPLWPVVLSLPALPFFAGLGAVGALLRRFGNLRRGALDSYFNPVDPRYDLWGFWGGLFLLLTVGAYVFAIAQAQPDPTGVLLLLFCASGLIAWPAHKLWLARYLPRISARSSISREAISRRIREQI